VGQASKRADTIAVIAFSLQIVSPFDVTQLAPTSIEGVCDLIILCHLSSTNDLHIALDGIFVAAGVSLTGANEVS
jgi:hypothetical protein